jgi:hypothetical protein
LTGDSLGAPRNPQLAWGELAGGGLGVYEIPGSHDTITGNNNTKIEEAHMQALAQRLRGCIDETLARGNNK